MNCALSGLRTFPSRYQAVKISSINFLTPCILAMKGGYCIKLAKKYPLCNSVPPGSPCGLDLNPDDQLLPRLDLVVLKIVQGFDLVDGKAFEFTGDVPQGIAILHGIGL